ncbi:hypothetical protein IR083_01170 [Dysgonomonas sp. GY75]|uniref:hypothetical protein n=1 Tax=Dysgonomonas sp. GY75 TaxID=2780419 RepID=UPI0018836CFD|nr:hypothetical protein [Dysgonomonas sp. GY75]MBF0647427.1 hypothetical protein [Dysgonomonas sp. GY75]
MIRILKITILSACCLLLAACSLVDFPEDCTYYGDAEIKPDWTAMDGGKAKPLLTDIYLLSPQQNYSYRIASDTLLKDVPAVSYKALAFNSHDLAGISYSGMDCPNTAIAELETYEKNGRIYTIQAPAFYTANTDLRVIPFETAVCEPVLRPAVRRVYIDFMVTGSTDMEVSAIGGQLSGIAYRYGFKQLDELESAAWLAFTSIRNMEKENLFSSALNVFGVNPGKQAAGSIDNLLEVVLQTTGGGTFSETVSLTDVFNGFTARSIRIIIEVRLSAVGIEVSVTDWITGQESNVEL